MCSDNNIEKIYPKIRLAGREDLHDVAMIFRNNFPESLYSRLDSCTNNENLVKYLSLYLIHYPDYFYVAAGKSKIVGFVLGYDNKKEILANFYMKYFGTFVIYPKAFLIVVQEVLKLLPVKLKNIFMGGAEKMVVINEKYKSKTDIVESSFHLFYIAVSPEERGKKTSRELLEKFTDAVKMRGRNRCMLCVRKENERALNFYLKNHFEYYATLGDSDYVMVKEL